MAKFEISALLRSFHSELGITDAHLAANRLVLTEQPPLSHLQVVEIDYEGKPFILDHAAAVAWRKMVDSAASEDIHLRPYSGFRSYAHQKRLIEGHIKNGRALTDILTHIAIPGFSEHHSGRAVDIHAEGRSVLDEAFEQTPAFAWLRENAGRFEFRLSYPRGNSQGIIYEPWHWLYAGQ